MMTIFNFNKFTFISFLKRDTMPWNKRALRPSYKRILKGETQ